MAKQEGQKPKGPARTPAIERFSKKYTINSETGCWEWEARLTPGGYGQFFDPEASQSGNVRAHRFSWTYYYGPIPENMCVCHKCDNTRCVNPEHLFLATNEGNTRDRVHKMRSVMGERVHTAKLTPKKVKLVRKLYACGASIAGLARMFEITSSTVFSIVRRESWKQVK